MPRARLAALHTLLAGLIARPTPGALVVACADFEVFYLLHTLALLDRDSPADRFLTLAASFVDAPTFLAQLPPASDASPDSVARLSDLCASLLADLPPGDHRLVCALIPGEIADPTGFVALTRSLLTNLPTTLQDPRLRLIIRDDIRAPHSFSFASACPSEQILAYRFSLPPELLIRELHTIANDPQHPPDHRAQALLQLAGQDLAHRRHADAMNRCELAARVATTPTLRTLALAFKADAQRSPPKPRGAPPC